MHLFAKHSGTTKRFDHVEDWTLEHLHDVAKEAFNIEGGFSLYIGDNKLDHAKSSISSSDIVSGDRIRVVLESDDQSTADEKLDEKLSEPPVESISSSTEQPASEHSFESAKNLVINVMEQAGYSVLRDRGSLIQFKHPNTQKLAEIGLLEYDDEHFSTQVNLFEPPSSRIPIASRFFTKNTPTLYGDLKKRVVEQLNFYIFGPENPLIRVLFFQELAEKIFVLLPPISVLRLESICKDASRICNDKRMERVWMMLVRRDFGNTKPKPVETYRECYKRNYMERRKLPNQYIGLFPRSTGNSFIPYVGIPDPDEPSLLFPRNRIPPRPCIYDPDFPVGPFAVRPDFPFGRSEPLFPPVNPRSDPFGNSELMPSRPQRQQGQPREFPRGGGPSNLWFG